MATKLLRYTPWLTFCGCLVFLLGLCLDGLIHRQFPELALQENILSLTNPGHFLIALGVALIVVNMEFFLLWQAWQLKKTALLKSGYLFMAAIWLIGLCIIGLLLTLGTGDNTHALHAANLTTPVLIH
jgi:hypothetical protein